MDTTTLFLAVLSLFGWGVGSFISKIATNTLGEKAVFWDLIGYFPAIVLYSLFIFRAKDIFSADRPGIFYALLAGALGSVGVVCFYLLLTKKDASSAVPLTALYPALTAILAIIFLRESLTWIKAVGILLSAIALVLLSL